MTEQVPSKDRVSELRALFDEAGRWDTRHAFGRAHTAELFRIIDALKRERDMSATVAGSALTELHEKVTAHEPRALPAFVRRDVERAIESALHPKGMSTHDGKAVIGVDRLAYMLKLIDERAAQPPPVDDIRDAIQQLDAAKECVTVGAMRTLVIDALLTLGKLVPASHPTKGEG